MYSGICYKINACEKSEASRRESAHPYIDLRESIRREAPKFMASERFAWIASKLQFAIFNPPKCDSQTRGSVREPRNDSREPGLSFKVYQGFRAVFPFLCSTQGYERGGQQTAMCRDERIKPRPGWSLVGQESKPTQTTK